MGRLGDVMRLVSFHSVDGERTSGLLVQSFVTACRVPFLLCRIDGVRSPGRISWTTRSLVVKRIAQPAAKDCRACVPAALLRMTAEHLRANSAGRS